MFNFDWAKRSHKGLRRWILYIVKDGPKSGVEIMDMMEGNLQGWWRPSPGSIYPLLEKMVEEGVLKKSEDKRYSLTEKGMDEIERPFPWLGREQPSARSPQEVLELMSSYISYLEDLERSGRKVATDNAHQIKELSERLAKLGANA